MTAELTATQEAQRLILKHWGNWQQIEELLAPISGDQIESLWDKYSEEDIQDAINEVRWHGDEVVGINTRFHYSWGRHYDVEVRVISLNEGTGLAYNFVSGGGKHGEPESYPWWQEAWYVKCTGTKTVVTNTYEDIPAQEDSQ